MRYDYISRHAGATTVYVSSCWRHAGATPTYLLEACMRYDYISSVLHIYYYICVLILEACRLLLHIYWRHACATTTYRGMQALLLYMCPHAGGMQALLLHIYWRHACATTTYRASCISTTIHVSSYWRHAGATTTYLNL